MDTLLDTAEPVSVSEPIAQAPQGAPRSGQRVRTMTNKQLLTYPVNNGQLRVKLPGAGSVRVDVDKHVDKALKGKNNEFAGKSKPAGHSEDNKR